ncbi:probable glycosyltransferase At5g20260 [Chenopodium quinoa]|nr:probable glycosyltransferase At5g20260 [Chenopodium quinoa]
MANTTTKFLLLIPTFLLIIFFYSSFLNQNHFNSNPTSNKKLSDPPSNLPVNISNEPNGHVRHNISFSTILEKEEKEKEKEKKKKSSLEKIEEGLARARAAIREAARSRNYTFKEQVTTFIPRGSVYRNQHAFYQSHIEMIKRFKIWTYREGEQPLVHLAPLNNIYGIEGQFIDEIEGKMSSNKFAAHQPDEAHVFFLPFSVANTVDFLYRPLISYNRGPLYRVALDYVNVVVEKYPYWNRSHGADHFMLSCHDWAPSVSYANPKLFNNLIRALCNANSSEGFLPIRDVSIPEVNIPPRKLNPSSFGLRISQRNIFAFFAGRTHGHVRKYLFEQWKDKKDEDIRVFEYVPKNLNYFKMLGQSKYCLCPSGYEVASPRIVEAIHAECIPVIIKDNYSFPFNDVLDWSKFSIHIPVARIPEIKTILKGISTRKYLKLVKGVRSVKWHFTLNRPSKPFDLIHMVLHSIWLRRLDIRLPYQ